MECCRCKTINNVTLRLTERGLLAYCDDCAKTLPVVYMCAGCHNPIGSCICNVARCNYDEEPILERVSV